jgi:hypothetical protein
MCFLSIEWYQLCWGFLCVLLYLWPTSRYLGLCVVLMNAYHIQLLCAWYRSIDMDCIVFLVKFEAGLFLTILKNRTVHDKMLQLKVDEFIKIPTFERRSLQSGVWFQPLRCRGLMTLVPTARCLYISNFFSLRLPSTFFTSFPLTFYTFIFFYTLLD